MHGNITSIESSFSRGFDGSNSLRLVLTRGRGLNCRGYLAMNHPNILYKNNNKITTMMMKHRIAASQSDEVCHTMYQHCSTSKMTKEK
jgi:hypothetical protein